MEHGFATRRQEMVERQIAARGVRDPRVLDAMLRVPREDFVPPRFADLAYEDGPLPIAEEQTISQPYIVAAMAEALELAPGDYGNVHVLAVDGTLGWPEHAPYDGIVAAAGGPEVPPSLLAQLAVGGRLVMPIGPTPLEQTLVRLRRTCPGPDDLRRETLGAVRFVPLIGAEGWQEEGEGRPLWSHGDPVGSRALSKPK